jgi:hypothetical protein
VKINITILLLSLFISAISYSQENNCIVARIEISGTYSGGCKEGLAHGKGIATGIDRYEGMFRSGLPEGKGTYKWADGSYYTGMWSKGQRDGKGKMVYRDSTITGYWKEDRYVGQKIVPDYEIIRSSSVSRYIVRKVAGSLNEVRIRLQQSGADLGSVGDLSFNYSSGDEYRDGRVYGIQNVHYPVTVRIRYKTMNLMRSTQINVEFEFRINSPGTWEVIINN